MDDLEGTFLFGRPSGRCAPRGRPGAAAVVLGVHPSALHVRWIHPQCQVAALAVDEEPWPFWDGAGEAERIERWRRDVGWQEEWGRVDPVGRLDGSSGRTLRDQVLRPPGLGPEDVWLTDALPFLSVHRGPRTQGAAMAERYDPFARSRGLPVHRLPDRPTRARLVERAVVEEGPRLGAGPPGLGRGPGADPVTPRRRGAPVRSPSAPRCAPAHTVGTRRPDRSRCLPTVRIGAPPAG